MGGIRGNEFKSNLLDHFAESRRPELLLVHYWQERGFDHKTRIYFPTWNASELESGQNLSFLGECVAVQLWPFKLQ